MFDLSFMVWLFPVVFMIHEFEEIIFFKLWFRDNDTYLLKRFPKLAETFLPRIGKLSVQAFTVAVAEEFALLSLVTIISVLLDTYLLWLAMFMGFFIHLLVHLVQWLVFRRYIPAIYTTFISLIYSSYSLYFILSIGLFEIKQIIVWSIIGVGIVFGNLFFAHKLAELFDKRTKAE